MNFTPKFMFDCMLNEMSSYNGNSTPLLELDISSGVFSVKSSLKNKRGLFTFAHAPEKCKKRTSPIMNFFLFSNPLNGDWQETVNHMIVEGIGTGGMTKITRWMESSNDEPTVKVRFVRTCKAPDGDLYKGEMSLILKAVWPSIGGVYARDLDSVAFKDRAFKIADPTLDPKYQDILKTHTVAPLSKTTLKGINWNSWSFVIIGYAGQFTKAADREIYYRPADITFPVEYPETSLNAAEFMALQQYSKAVSGEYSMFLQQGE